MRIANSNPALLNTLSTATLGEARQATLSAVNGTVTSGLRPASDAFVNQGIVAGRGGCFPGTHRPDVSGSNTWVWPSFRRRRRW